MKNQTATTDRSIKTLDIQAKEWFDKVNGNSYFSARITVNFGLPWQKVIAIHFQYGYGNTYAYQAFKALQDAGDIPQQEPMAAPWRYYQDNGIIVRSKKEDKCLQRDVKAWGKL